MIERYLGALDAELAAALGDRLLAVVLGGSTALGEHVPGTSDVDVLAVVDGPLPERAKRDVAGRVDHARLPCPARGLELVVYPREAVVQPTARPRFELNLNTGARMAPRVTFDPADEPAFWFVLDLALAAAHGRALRGSRLLLGEVPRALVVPALRESLAWHAAHEAGNERSLLAACRAWRYAVVGELGSKEAAANWARGRVDDGLLDAALARRRGGDAPLDPDRVRQVTDRAAGALDAT